MKKKQLLIAAVILVAGAGIAYVISRRKKQKTFAAHVEVNSDPIAGEAVIKPGSIDQINVVRLQEILNAFHAASIYANTHCSGVKWPEFKKWPLNQFGKIIAENGNYDDKTKQVAQYYLNQSEVSLSFLNQLRTAVDSYRKGDKCKHPIVYLPLLKQSLANITRNILIGL